MIRRGKERGKRGTVKAVQIEAGTAEAALGRDPTMIAPIAGAAEAIAIVPLELEARDGKGRVLSCNTLELCVMLARRRGAVAARHR